VVVGTNVASPIAIIPVADQRTYRLYQAGYGDVALLLLASDAPVLPAILNETDLATTVTVGVTQVTAVGYGTNDVVTGVRRGVDLTVLMLGPRTFFAGAEEKNICTGDRAAPIFPTVDGERLVIGFAGDPAPPCNLTSQPALLYRVDAFLDDFIYPAIDAWEGPCRLDSICVTAGCRTPDPDCDPCGADGTCTPDCPTPDWDCPLAGLPEDPCTDAFDCESRLCQPATEDPRVLYCTQRCDPARPFCPVGMTCTADALCVYDTKITPRTQGAACQGGGDCRSGMCDLVDHICVEPCDKAAGDAACPAGYECQLSSDGQDVCRYPQPDGHGFCEVAIRRRGPTAWALLLVVAVVLGCARRRRGRTS